MTEQNPTPQSEPQTDPQPQPQPMMQPQPQYQPFAQPAFNPMSLANDGQDFTLEGLAKEIGRKDD